MRNLLQMYIVVEIMYVWRILALDGRKSICVHVWVL